MSKVKKAASLAILGAIGSVVALAAAAQVSAINFRNTITGEILNFNDALPEDRDTVGVKTFMETGRNPYIEDLSCLKQGEQIFLSACSGCHGHLGEGKIGPGLNDSYWTYPQNETDEGLFSTIFGGAQGAMGPQYQNLTLDEMLKVMSWVRHLYKDAPEKATWLTAEQQKKFKPFPGHESFPDDPPGLCKPKGK